MMFFYAPVPNELPTIITEPSDYITRDGRRVTIHEITASTPGTTAFSAKGAVWAMYRGKVRARGYDIWHISGRRNPLKESVTDIIGKWTETSAT